MSNAVQPIRNITDIEKMKQVLKAQSERDYFMFYLGINLGFRISDLIKLKVGDIRNKTHLIVDEDKTDKKRRIMINKKVQSSVKEYTRRMNDTDYLFPSRKGDQPIQRNRAYTILNKAAQEIGLSEVGTHTLRKTYGYHHYKKHNNIALLQKLLNHSSPKETLRYIGIDQDEMDNSMEDFEL